MENIGEKHEGKKGDSCLFTLFKLWLVVLVVGTIIGLLYQGLFKGDFRSLNPLIFFGLIYFIYVKIAKKNPLLNLVGKYIKLDFLFPFTAGSAFSTAGTKAHGWTSPFIDCMDSNTTTSPFPPFPWR